MADKKRGFFITLEGPDGSGKSTQFRILAEKLKQSLREVTETREPGGNPLSEKIRSLLLSTSDTPPAPEAELLLFLAARAQHVRDVIRPALQRNHIVLCERFSDSTYAYQVGGRKLPAAVVSSCDRFATHGLKPDLTLLFLLPPAQGLQRAYQAKQGHDRMESESLAFQKRVYAAYRRIAAREPRRVEIIPANRPQETVAADVWFRVLARLKKRPEAGHAI
jgi:dTMP kinase